MGHFSPWDFTKTIIFEENLYNYSNDRSKGHFLPWDIFDIKLELYTTFPVLSHKDKDFKMSPQPRP